MQLIPYFKDEGAFSAPNCASLFISKIVRLFGVLEIMLHDCDSRFISNFWKDLWELLGTKVLFISAYHLYMDA